MIEGDGGHGEVLRAALDHWEQIARYAWARHEELGRGVVLVARDELLFGSSDELDLSYVPLVMIPRGDDFRGVIGDYDPLLQVALMVGGDGDEQLLVLEPGEAGRPPPPEC